MVIVIVIAVLSFFPLNRFLITRALYLFKAGGNFKIIYCFETDKKNTFPKEIIDKIKEGQTKELLVLLKASNIIYVKVKDNNMVLGIKTDNISSEKYPIFKSSR